MKAMSIKEKNKKKKTLRIRAWAIFCLLQLLSWFVILSPAKIQIDWNLIAWHIHLLWLAVGLIAMVVLLIAGFWHILDDIVKE